MSDAINCPKCDAPMRQLKLDDVIIDRCEKCWGIWLDAGERVKVIAKAKTAGVVDIGPESEDDATGATDVPCPRGHGPMQLRRAADAGHIEYESCSECGGSFYDAGELRDMAQLSIADVVRIFTRLRT